MDSSFVDSLLLSTVDIVKLINSTFFISLHPGRGLNTPSLPTALPLLESRVSCFIPGSSDPGTTGRSQRRLFQFRSRAWAYPPSTGMADEFCTMQPLVKTRTKIPLGYGGHRSIGCAAGHVGAD
jgi:hypothetical protein